MDKKTSQLVGGLLILTALGVGIYAVSDNSNSGNTNNTQIPANGTLNTPYGAWQNTTGAPVWLTATGVLVNGAGDLLGNIADLLGAINQGNNSGSGGGGSAGGMAGIGQPNYYNPLPGGFM